jgi:Tfp pilus assembly protein PilN
MDEFPVLKAFQQYIDAEQAKARKRLLSLGIFFGILTGAIIAVFVVMLVNMTSRNQQLNDRLVEYAMKERDRQSAVVVQPPQDNGAILALTSKIEELQRKLDESRAKAEKEAAVAAERARLQAEAEAARPKGPTPEELEIKRLKDLLAAEREKASEQARQEKLRLEKERAAEKERKRQEELEAYRRKHYPELYGLPKTLSSQHGVLQSNAKGSRRPANEDDDLLPDDDDAIDYFEGMKSEPTPPAKKARPSRRPAKSVEAPKAKAEKPAQEEQPYTIPVEVKGKNSSFRIPL